MPDPSCCRPVSVYTMHAKQTRSELGCIWNFRLISVGRSGLANPEIRWTGSLCNPAERQVGEGDESAIDLQCMLEMDQPAL